jgi:hypothetical protein
MCACVANPSILSFALLRTALLGLLSILSVYSQSLPSEKYVISIGTPSERVASGTVWLYSYSWYGLQKIQLGTIKNGIAQLLLDAGKLKNELDPHPNTDGYVVAIQIGNYQWYRSPDIAPDRLWGQSVFGCELSGTGKHFLDRGQSTDSPFSRQSAHYPAISERTSCRQCEDHSFDLSVGHKSLWLP